MNTSSQIDKSFELKSIKRIYGTGLAIEFKINGNIYRRVSSIHAPQFLFWKRINGDCVEYLDEIQSMEMEGIVKAFLYGDKFKEILSIER